MFHASKNPLPGLAIVYLSAGGIVYFACSNSLTGEHILQSIANHDAVLVGDTCIVYIGGILNFTVHHDMLNELTVVAISQ